MIADDLQDGHGAVNCVQMLAVPLAPALANDFCHFEIISEIHTHGRQKPRQWTTGATAGSDRRTMEQSKRSALAFLYAMPPAGIFQQ